MIQDQRIKEQPATRYSILRPRLKTQVDDSNRTKRSFAKNQQHQLRILYTEMVL